MSLPYFAGPPDQNATGPRPAQPAVVTDGPDTDATFSQQIHDRDLAYKLQVSEFDLCHFSMFSSTTVFW